MALLEEQAATRWDAELVEWMTKQQQKQQLKVASRMTESRASMVNKGKTFGVITVALMWFGVFSGVLISFFGLFIVIALTALVAVSILSKTANKKINDWIDRSK